MSSQNFRATRRVRPFFALLFLPLLTTGCFNTPTYFRDGRTLEKGELHVGVTWGLPIVVPGEATLKSGQKASGDWAQTASSTRKAAWSLSVLVPSTRLSFGAGADFELGLGLGPMSMELLARRAIVKGEITNLAAQTSLAMVPLATGSPLPQNIRLGVDGSVGKTHEFLFGTYAEFGPQAYARELGTIPETDPRKEGPRSSGLTLVRRELRIVAVTGASIEVGPAAIRVGVAPYIVPWSTMTDGHCLGCNDVPIAFKHDYGIGVLVGFDHKSKKKE